jgi:hypothetical protein
MRNLRVPTRAGDVERFADDLANDGDEYGVDEPRRDHAIEMLLLALTSEWVRNDGDAEDAVCSALVRIGVMTRCGNLVFEFVPDAHLSTSDRAAVGRYRGWLPNKYYAAV